MVRLLQRLHRPRRRPKQHARGRNEAPRVVDEESLGTGIEKAREKVVKLPKIITCTKGGGKCGDASGALCTQRGCKRSADARARGRCAAASALCRGGDGTHGCKPWMCDTRRCAACHTLGMLGLKGCAVQSRQVAGRARGAGLPAPGLAEGRAHRGANRVGACCGEGQGAEQAHLAGEEGRSSRSPIDQRTYNNRSGGRSGGGRSRNVNRVWTLTWTRRRPSHLAHARSPGWDFPR